MAGRPPDPLGRTRFAATNVSRERRRMLDPVDLLQRGRVRIEHLDESCFPASRNDPRQPPSHPEYQPDPEREAHERAGALDGGHDPQRPVPPALARGDHCHHFTHPHRVEVRCVAGSDPGWEEKLVAAGDTPLEGGENPWIRRVWWALLDDDPEARQATTQVAPGPQLVFVEYTEDGGATYSEPELVAVAPPSARNATYRASRTYNFDPEAGDLAEVRVTVLLAHNPQGRAFKVVRSGRDGYLDREWVPVMVGATSGTDGQKGLVPAPVAGEEGLFLRGDGSFAAPAGAAGTYETAAAVVPHTTDFALTALDTGKTHTNAGALGMVTGTIPAGANDLVFHFVVVANQTLRINTDTGAVIYVGASASMGVGGYIECSDPGASVTLVGISGALYARAFTGTWTVV